MRTAVLKEACFCDWCWFRDLCKAVPDAGDAIVGYDGCVVCGGTIEDETYQYARDFNSSFLAKQCGFAKRALHMSTAFVCDECVDDLESQPGCYAGEPASSRAGKKKKQGQKKKKHKRKWDTAGLEKSEGIQASQE
mmetsp:Transcript_51189/g.158455  ORF Transcript_51189/g.158455 Transcript_51189/m.158455 type:complete len:136 (+) Transcript_51189:427-834(+)